jgi:hypothetical protein
MQSTPGSSSDELLASCRDKWLFVSATPLSSELPEVANPSDLFTHDPFDFDTSDPDTQARHATRSTRPAAHQDCRQL